MKTSPSEKSIGKKRYHLSILLFGASSVFIKLIHIPAVNIVAGRFFISAVTLMLFFIATKKIKKVGELEKKNYIYLIFAGLLLAIHGCSFAVAIHWSSVAIGTITFACFPVFSLILEKIITKKGAVSEIKPFMLFSAFMTIVGVVILVPEFTLTNVNMQSVFIGLLSAITFAAHFIINDKVRKNIKDRNGSPENIGLFITFYDHLFAAIFLIPVSLLTLPTSFQFTDILYLLILGVFITAIGFTIYNSALEHYNPTTIGIASSLEAVYGILFALVFMQAVPTLREFIGGAIIISSVGFNEWQKKLTDARTQNWSK